MNSTHRRRVGAVGALLGLLLLAATLAAAPRVGGAATADLDAVGRHPGFRWPVEPTETGDAIAPIDPGFHWPVEHEEVDDAMASPTTEGRAPVDR